METEPAGTAAGVDVWEVRGEEKGGPTAGEPPALRTRLCWHAEVRSAGVGQITAWAGALSRAGLAVSFEMISSHPGGAVRSGRGWV